MADRDWRPSHNSIYGNGHIFQVDDTIDEQWIRMQSMWEELIRMKQNIRDGSRWYIIEYDWLQRWKEYSNSAWEDDDPGPIANDLLLEDNENIVYVEKEDSAFKDCYTKVLKDGLRENRDYYIVSPEIWNYLQAIYWGDPIVRYGRRVNPREGSRSKCEIDVNLVKLKVFDIPEEVK